MMGNDLERLCKRYEIAVGNFGRSCAAMRANEKCFQAWYASCVIQEFGLSRVYREGHLSKGSLIPPHALWKALNQGNELFPDLVVSWEPDIDARHSRSRPNQWREADAMLSQIAIVSELKVTGSTGISTGIHQFRQDLAKLAVFTAACPMTNGQRKIASYMVLLDNHCDDCGEPTAKYEEQAIRNILKDRAQEWPADVPLPVVMLIGMNGQDTTVTRFTEQPRGSAVMGRRLIWRNSSGGVKETGGLNHSRRARNCVWSQSCQASVTFGSTTKNVTCGPAWRLADQIKFEIA